jgi:hypothetical protein
MPVYQPEPITSQQRLYGHLNHFRMPGSDTGRRGAHGLTRRMRRRYAIANVAAAVFGCTLLSRADGARSQGALTRQRVLTFAHLVTPESEAAPHAVAIE